MNLGEELVFILFLYLFFIFQEVFFDHFTAHYGTLTSGFILFYFVLSH